MPPWLALPQPVLQGHALLLLVDGHCVLCESASEFLYKLDRRGLIYFASLQGPWGQAARLHWPMLAHADSVVALWVQGGQLQHSLRAAAVARALALLPAPWQWLAVYRYLPTVIQNGLYNFVAAKRYRIFGRKNQCGLPSQVQRYLG